VHLVGVLFKTTSNFLPTVGNRISIPRAAIPSVDSVPIELSSTALLNLMKEEFVFIYVSTESNWDSVG
jgi:hypothetical protein